ncbi:MAG: DUF3417 domain-containing protein, partial [Planctomycetota bacterium]
MTGETESLHGRLTAVAKNLWWSWTPEAIAVFRELDPVLWREVGHNAVRFLRKTTPERVQERAAELALVSRINYIYHRMNEYLQSEHHWANVRCGGFRNRPIAYFSAEFALHESMPVYSGGLGVLAGDHLKSASDLGVPLVGVGLLYNQGYFSQRISPDGWQEEDYVNLVPSELPMEPARDERGDEILVRCVMRDSAILARV